MRLLLVEDDEIPGDGIVAGLREFSFTTDWLKDGRHVDTAIAGTEYDAIILDLNLPGESGLALLVKIRNSGRATPVLILNARDTPEDDVASVNRATCLIKQLQTLARLGMPFVTRPAAQSGWIFNRIHQASH